MIINIIKSSRVKLCQTLNGHVPDIYEVSSPYVVHAADSQVLGRRLSWQDQLLFPLACESE